MVIRVPPISSLTDAKRNTLISKSLPGFKSIASSMEADLVNHLIPFWLALKDSKGGFYGFVDFKGLVNKQADKGALLNSRILWFFLELL